MDYWLSLFLMPLALAAVAAFVLTPLVMVLYRKLGWVDDPARQSAAKVIHTQPVPRGGGVVIALAVLVAMGVFLGFDQHSVGIALGLVILALVGIWDDVKDLNPYLRLGLGVVASLMVVGAGIGIGFVTNPFGGVVDFSYLQVQFEWGGEMRSLWVMAHVLAVVWMLWLMNMVNWAKGLDGQLPGIVVVAAGVIGILSLRHSEDVTQWSVAVLAAITAGSYLGFLPWNFYPQKIMPGYGGGSIAGFLLAVLSILSGAKLATMIIVLGVPMMDALYTILRRVWAGKSPVWGDRGHLHHLLLDLGWSKRRVAIFYWLVSLVFGFIALQLNSAQKLFTIVLLLVGVGGWLLWLKYFLTYSRRPDQDNG